MALKMSLQVRLDAARGRQVKRGVRLLALNLKHERKTCRSRAARGSLSMQLHVSLSRYAAALRGILDPARRTLSRSFQGG